MRWKTSHSFFAMSVRPHRDGTYDLVREDGSLTPIDYRNDAWQTDIASFIGWRGMELQTTKDTVLKERRALSRYRYSAEQTHQRALKAAVRLARHHASGCRFAKAFRFYLIANRMDPTRLPEVDRKWMELNVSRVDDCRAAIDWKVDDFFRKRGAPQLQIHQIVGRRGI
jgi:hypothetical protein